MCANLGYVSLVTLKNFNVYSYSDLQRMQLAAIKDMKCEILSQIGLENSILDQNI